MGIKYSIVVPCYNEEGNIYKLVDEFVKVNDALEQYGFELILVNNGSRDNTSEEIAVCAKKYEFIRMVQVEINQGYGYGILRGMSSCRGEFIGWIHADLQFSPFLFIEVADDIRKRAGNSKSKLYYKGLRKNRPISDRFFTFCMSCFETIYLGKGLWDINAQPTLMNRELFDNAQNPPYGFAIDLFFYYTAKKNKYRVQRFVSHQRSREIGKSSWNTGMSARINLIIRILRDSKTIKANQRKYVK